MKKIIKLWWVGKLQNTWTILYYCIMYEGLNYYMLQSSLQIQSALLDDWSHRVHIIWHLAAHVARDTVNFFQNYLHLIFRLAIITEYKFTISVTQFALFGIETSNDELDLPFIYWSPKMHKNPYKHRFIAGSSKCSTKPLSILLTKLLTHIKQGLQKYCETAYSRSGINHMWIIKNSKKLLEHLKSPTFNHVTSIKSFDFFHSLYNHTSPEIKRQTH